MYKIICYIAGTIIIVAMLIYIKENIFNHSIKNESRDKIKNKIVVDTVFRYVNIYKSDKGSIKITDSVLVKCDTIIKYIPVKYTVNKIDTDSLNKFKAELEYCYPDNVWHNKYSFGENKIIVKEIEYLPGTQEGKNYKVSLGVIMPLQNGMLELLPFIKAEYKKEIISNRISANMAFEFNLKEKTIIPALSAGLGWEF